MPRPHTPRNKDERDSWISTSSNLHMEREPIRGSDRSAYQDARDRHTGQGPISSTQYGSLPVVSTTGPALNKPLPPSPEAERKKRRPSMSLRSLVRRRPSDADDTFYLQPSTAQHQRSSSANSWLSPDLGHNPSPIQSSRSMPASPMRFPDNYSPPSLARALSSATNYSGSCHTYADSYQGRTQYGTQYAPAFVSSPPTSRRTYPDDAASTGSSLWRQRPHTWLSPMETSEPFHDVSEVRLFAEATCGLPDGNAFSTVSPIGPPQLQGSLFHRGEYQDTIHIHESHSRRPHSTSHTSSDWQSYDYPSPPPSAPLTSGGSYTQARRSRHHSYQTSSSSVQHINLELEGLGISDDEDNDDELPDYAQSQAEMSAKKRKEAADRAKELEERWRRSRQRRGH